MQDDVCALFTYVALLRTHPDCAVGRVVGLPHKLVLRLSGGSDRHF